MARTRALAATTAALLALPDTPHTLQSGPCPVQVPYVFRYLVAELLSMNIKLSLTIKPEM